MKSTLIFASFAALAAALPQDRYVYVTRLTTQLTKSARPTSTSCTLTICADYINSCGLGYGGCYPACPGLPTPTFTPPPCPTTTKKPTIATSKKPIITTSKKPTITTSKKPTTTTSKKPCQTICVDAVNECGIKYGGCYCSEEPFPYPKPPCPTTTTTMATTTTTTTTTNKTAKPSPTPVGPRKCGGLLGQQCNKGEICIDDPNSPCGIAVDCLGICVTGEFCGGFANFQCTNKGDVCIDDPRDDCSPKTGGADCGGVCVPGAWVY